MAESVVSILVEKLSLLIENEAKLLGGVKGQVLSLRTELEFILQFLTDAEKKRKEFPMVEVWVKNIRDLSYEAEDIIDAFVLEDDRQRSRNIGHKIICFCGRFTTLHEIGKQIEQVNARSKEIADYRSRYHLDVSEQPQHAVEDLASWRRSNPTIDEPIIVGLHEEAADLADWLMKEDDNQGRIMSITGMGGLGKTTLAKKVYNNIDVEKHFNTRAWISVSQEYRLKDLLLSILKQVKITATDKERLQKLNAEELELDRLQKLTAEELKLELSKLLQEKRYLVVIDDVWEPEAWDQIGAAFPNNQNGSKVILTTRNKHVTPSTDPSIYHHELRLLNRVESWELLCRKVFSTSTSPPDELVKVGEQIVEKCGRLPLAIIVIGGLLRRRDKTHEAWSKVLASVNWQLSQDSNQCQKVLALSYADLPLHLKPCFLYLGLFPEDFEINVKQLILMWVAEGFVQVRGEQNMEDVAEDYFEELVRRSMIQLSERKYHGGPVATCRIHDLLRDLAISEGRKDGFLKILKNTDSSFTTRSRRLAIHFLNGSECSNLLPKHSRSLLWFFSRDYDYLFRWKATFGGLKMLRVLSLEGITLSKGLSKEISKLILLQYLNLRKTTLASQNILSFIDNLVKLQTLDLRGILIFWTIGRGIWKLKHLRHLFLDQVKIIGDVVIEELPRNLLTLHTRSSVWMSMDGRFSKAFVKFNCLRTLKLIGKIVRNHQQLENCFPSSLIELILWDWLLEEDSFRVFGSLPKLRELLLLGDFSYKGYSMTFFSEEFVQLQFLSIDTQYSLERPELEELELEDGALRNLKHLRISTMKLKKIPDGLEKITTLEKLELLCMSSTFKERVEENGEDWEKIKHIPFVNFDYDLVDH